MGLRTTRRDLFENIREMAFRVIQSRDLRRQLQRQPYIAALHSPGEVDERIARFMEREERWGDTPVRVVEAAGAAGDVILCHPLLIHAAAPNTASSGIEPG